MIKNWIKPRRVEWVSFYTMMPVICFLLNYLLYGDRIYSDYRIWVFSFPIIFLQGFISWYLHIVVMHWLRVKLPLLKQTTLRLTILALAHISMTFLTFVTIFYAYDVIHFFRLHIRYFKIAALFIRGYCAYYDSNYNVGR